MDPIEFDSEEEEVRDSADWRRVWRDLAAHPVNDGLLHPHTARERFTGECWQYMGLDDAGLWHEFRHRCHPKFGARVFLCIPHADADCSTPLQIGKRWLVPEPQEGLDAIEVN